ncbi:glycosyltransferase [Aggregatibacter sp. 2125159857]|uniref:CgeB family protein n=1 Tax=Aggregatibacter sp. 2125159857 TaxID=2820817 RepID=UPI001ADECFFA|nr:glycosyltransferase [Aggregatibacter sp. 2125159857]QTO00969.1 glycosyltransferase [Aggregatibacter sp. 2125159857]
MKKILLTGASPDIINHNTVMRDYVCEGIEQVIGKKNVKNVSLAYAAKEQLNNPSDVVLVFGSCMPDLCNYSELKIACNKTNAILVFWLHDDPYEQDYNYKILDIADFIFSNDKWASKFYEHNKCFHLPMAASKKAHFREVNNNWTYDAFFCGVAFPNRIQFFKDAGKYLSKLKTTVKGAGWPEELSFTINERIDNALLPDMMNKSKFIFNLGRHLDLGNKRFQLTASTPGPRTFEAAMAGTVQLYYVESLEITEYYTDKKEILLFDSINELKEITSRLLDKDHELMNIAKNAQERTIKEHTYKTRIEQMLSIINNHA